MSILYLVFTLQNELDLWCSPARDGTIHAAARSSGGVGGPGDCPNESKKGDEKMKKRTDERRKLNQLISQMDNAQFEWFISQMRLVLFEEDDEPAHLKDRPQTHT